MVVLRNFEQEMAGKSNHNVEVVWHSDEAVLEVLFVEDHFEDCDCCFVGHAGCCYEMGWYCFPVQAFEDLVSEVELSEMVVKLESAFGEISYTWVWFEYC